MNAITQLFIFFHALSQCALSHADGASRFSETFPQLPGSIDLYTVGGLLSGQLHHSVESPYLPRFNSESIRYSGVNLAEDEYDTMCIAVCLMQRNFTLSVSHPLPSCAQNNDVGTAAKIHIFIAFLPLIVHVYFKLKKFCGSTSASQRDNDSLHQQLFERSMMQLNVDPDAIDVPDDFVCPISLLIITNPFALGHAYEATALYRNCVTYENWRIPHTNALMSDDQLKRVGAIKHAMASVIDTGLRFKIRAWIRDVVNALTVLQQFISRVNEGVNDLAIRYKQDSDTRITMTIQLGDTEYAYSFGQQCYVENVMRLSMRELGCEPRARRWLREQYAQVTETSQSIPYSSLAMRQ